MSNELDMCLAMYNRIIICLHGGGWRTAVGRIGKSDGKWRCKVYSFDYVI